LCGVYRVLRSLDLFLKALYPIKDIERTQGNFLLETRIYLSYPWKSAIYHSFTKVVLISEAYYESLITQNHDCLYPMLTLHIVPLKTF
jgi:hypothetical protein